MTIQGGNATDSVRRTISPTADSFFERETTSVQDVMLARHASLKKQMALPGADQSRLLREERHEIDTDLAYLKAVRNVIDSGYGTSKPIRVPVHLGRVYFNGTEEEQKFSLERIDQHIKTVGAYATLLDRKIESRIPVLTQRIMSPEDLAKEKTAVQNDMLARHAALKAEMSKPGANQVQLLRDELKAVTMDRAHIQTIGGLIESGSGTIKAPHRLGIVYFNETQADQAYSLKRIDQRVKAMDAYTTLLEKKIEARLAAAPVLQPAPKREIVHVGGVILPVPRTEEGKIDLPAERIKELKSVAAKVIVERAIQKRETREAYDAEQPEKPALPDRYWESRLKVLEHQISVRQNPADQYKFLQVELAKARKEHTAVLATGTFPTFNTQKTDDVKQRNQMAAKLDGMTGTLLAKMTVLENAHPSFKTMYPEPKVRTIEGFDTNEAANDAPRKSWLSSTRARVAAGIGAVGLTLAGAFSGVARPEAPVVQKEPSFIQRMFSRNATPVTAPVVAEKAAQESSSSVSGPEFPRLAAK